jgi:hypothetical protein
VTTPDIAVEAGQLDRHAGNVESVDDELTKAANGASTVALNGDAFGLLIGFVGSWFQDKEKDLADKFQQTTVDLRTDASNLRGAADGYRHTDHSAASRTKAAGSPKIELPL